MLLFQFVYIFKISIKKFKWKFAPRLLQKDNEVQLYFKKLDILPNTYVMGVVTLEMMLELQLENLKPKKRPWLYIRSLVQECTLICFRFK